MAETQQNIERGVVGKTTAKPETVLVGIRVPISLLGLETASPEMTQALTNRRIGRTLLDRLPLVEKGLRQGSEHRLQDEDGIMMLDIEDLVEEEMARRERQRLASA